MDKRRSSELIETGVSSQSSGAYDYQISADGLRDWKRTFTAEKFAEVQSIKNQIVFSWCDINAFCNDVSTPVAKEQTGNRIYAKLRREKPTLKQKHILKSVSGIAYPGELLVIMGSSGAGKTTLLNCMTYRHLEGMKISGLVCINDAPVTQTQLASNSAYVQQDDLFIKYLTVREHLVFQARVRMDPTLTIKQKTERIDEVLRELSLKKCEDCQIGDPGIVKGISGGERKRLALAAELLTNPSILFCDEPTSGLDSFMSLSVVQMLKDISRTGRTVIATLHQPSSELYQMFDKLCLLAEGRTAFLGSPAEAFTFFNKLQAPCPKNFNPADYYIQILSIVRGSEEKSRRSVNTICDAFKACSLGVKIQKATSKTMKLSKDKEDPWRHSASHTSPYKVNWFSQLRALLWRGWLAVRKNPDVTTGRLLVIILDCILITLIYYGQVLDQVGIKNINGVFYYLLTSNTFQSIYSVINTFCAEQSLFFKEHKDGMYRTDAYYLSKLFCDLPFGILFCCLNTLLIYYFVGLNPEFNRFLMAVLVSLLMGQAAQGLGYIISTVASSAQMAAALVSGFITPLLFTGGIFLSVSSIPIYLRWMSNLSWFKFAYEGYLINQWSDIKYIPCDSNSSAPIVCISDGLEVLASQTIALNEMWPSLGAMFALALGFRLIAFLILLYKASK